MNDSSTPRNDYRRPPINRGVDPNRMNWLWRLSCEAAGFSVADTVAALKQIGVQVGEDRARGWLRSMEEEGYFPLSIAELEQNLRALKQVREQDTPED